MGRKQKVDYQSPFPERLRDLMQQTNTTQQALANALGITAAAVGYYRNGVSLPDLLGLTKIAQFFNVSCDYLLGITDTKSPNADIQAAAELTGLTGEDVETLIILKHFAIYDDVQAIYNTLGALLSEIRLELDNKTELVTLADCETYYKSSPQIDFKKNTVYSIAECTNALNDKIQVEENMAQPYKTSLGTGFFFAFGSGLYKEYVKETLISHVEALNIQMPGNRPFEDEATNNNEDPQEV